MRGDRASLGPKAIRRINRGGAAGSRPNKGGVDQKEVRESAEQTTRGGGRLKGMDSCRRPLRPSAVVCDKINDD